MAITKDYVPKVGISYTATATPPVSPGFTGDGSGLTNIPASAIQAHSVSNAALDPMLEQYATVSLTAAQLEAMYASPVSILAAPGAGKAIIVDSILFEFANGSTAFTSGGAVEFVYHGTGTAVHSGTIPASVVTSASSSNVMLSIAAGSSGTVIPPNTGIDISNATAAFATGNGTAKVQIWYSVVTL